MGGVATGGLPGPVEGAAVLLGVPGCDPTPGVVRAVAEEEQADSAKATQAAVSRAVGWRGPDDAAAEAAGGRSGRGAVTC